MNSNFIYSHNFDGLKVLLSVPTSLWVFGKLDRISTNEE